MRNNNLIPYKENILTRIFKFLKQIFKRKSEKETNKIKENESNLFERIQIKQDEETIRLKRLQLQYDNGEIEEEDISEEDVEKLIQMYEKETEELNRKTENIKIHVSKMLKELKNS